MPIRILHVDDDGLFLRVVRRSLTALGFEMHGASSADEAERAVAEQAFDIALVDLDLGLGPDGFDVVERLRAIVPELPAIILSGSIGPDDEARVAAFGAHVCPKLTPPKELAALIRTVAAEAMPSS